MSKLTADEVRTSHMINKYGQEAQYYLITVSSGDLYMKESEEGSVGAAQVRENADFYISEDGGILIKKWRMLKSKWSLTTTHGVDTIFHIAEI